ncbi:MAG: tRNA lysidine(34) synthetase TilS [Chloroflexi bacterium]|nr:tRNA lysidine(34) synthetase TilS [Chloroflexota bacterium]
MPPSVPSAIDAFLHRHGLRNSKIVVGVSGGADSIALMQGLLAVRATHGLRLHAAHLNHQLRGRESEHDALQVEQWMREWNVPLAIESHDVASFAKARKISMEEAARMVRYGFLSQVAEREGAQVVAVAHNADDQVETIVMHFLRGAGLAGLRGMPEVASHPLHPPLRLVRPLLAVPRTAIAAYVQSCGITPREDTTNADTRYLRNRLRHELLPLLESYNPNLRAVLRQNARLIGDDYEYVAQRARGAWTRTVLDETADSVAFSIGGWRQLQPSLKRAMVRQAVARLRPELRTLSAVHVEDALHVADAGHSGSRASLPAGLWLFRDFDAIVIAPKLVQPDMPGATAHAVQLKRAGRTPLAHGWHVEAHLMTREHLPADALQGIDPYEAFLDADQAGEHLTVRARAASDYFRPYGLGGHGKPLRRFLIDAKMPVAWRDRAPLVVGADGAVLWVVGWRIADPACIKPDTRHVLHLRFVKSDYPHHE